jgi:signal transduction histidine kinase
MRANPSVRRKLIVPSEDVQSTSGLMRFFGEARTRILLWSVILTILFLAIAVPTIRLRLFQWVDNRVREELMDEMTEFQDLLINGLEDDEQEILDAFRRAKRPIPNGVPKTREELKTLFEIQMIKELTEDDTFFIAILDGQFHKSSPRGLPPVMQPNAELMQRWAMLTQLTEGEHKTDDDEDHVLYIADPIRIDGDIVAVFVVAHTTEGERSEVLETTNIIFQVALSVLLSVMILTWLGAGKILAPLGLLAETALSISESDLKRISVTGKGEIAELATTFNEMMDRLEIAFETQRNFINDAGHELRTPITIVRGHLELMGNDPQEQQETLALVMDELDRMSRLVDDLLLLAKAERPDFLNLETIEVGAFTEELFAKIIALADRKWNLEATAKNALIIGDRQRLTQAVMNLAQNAAQHTTPSQTIALGSAVDLGTLKIWVRDMGEGIAPNEQEQIFQRFARSKRSRRRSEGAGLGLSIVTVIAEAHGGRVTLQSQLGTGSTFMLVLPIEPTSEIRRLLTDYESNSNR